MKYCSDDYEWLNVLCPMHIVTTPDGETRNAGPTLRKLFPEGELNGRNFLDLFEIKRPRAVTSMGALSEMAGTKLHMQFRAPPHMELKGVLTKGPSQGLLTINVSFGISIIEAVQQYRLTSADFAATDLTIEMLYLIEAKSAAMNATRNLNERLRAAREEAEERAVTDVLTGLKNRRAMDHMIAAYLDTGADFALMQIDLDFFKAVNDNMGHAAGDHVLKVVSKVMSEETRSIDTVARVGGDEFVILLQNMSDANKLSRIALRIIERLKQPIPFEGEDCQISASIGAVMTVQYTTVSADKMLRDADVALYYSKEQGRGRHTLYHAGLEPEVTDLERNLNVG